jgi:hypothetical protein
MLLTSVKTNRSWIGRQLNVRQPLKRIAITLIVLMCFAPFLANGIPPRAKTYGRLAVLRRAIVLYRREHRKLPTSLNLLPLVDGKKPKTVDGWDTPIVLQLGVDGSISLISLGADGKRGGSGVDADIIGTFDPKVAPDTPWIVNPFPFRRYPDTSSTHP